MATSPGPAESAAAEAAHEVTGHLPASVVAPVPVPAPLVTPEHAAANALVALSAANVTLARIAVRLERAFPVPSPDLSPISAFDRVIPSDARPSRKRARHAGAPGSGTASESARGGCGTGSDRSSTESADDDLHKAEQCL